METVCPACGFERDGGGEECRRCGLIFAKFQEPQPSPAPAASLSITPVASLPPESPPWMLVAAGAVAAALAHLMPPLAFLLRPLVTLLHEFGHAVTAWLLGCPAVPAFDFVYGGGVTHHQYFKLPLGIVIGAGWLWLGWTFRRNPRTLTLVGICAAVWMIAVSSEWRREVVIASMGHGGELILAAILLYMALAGVGWRLPSIERPLGAFAAFFVQFQTMGFAWRLRHDEAFLSWYRDGKGGAMMNDLEVVALDIKIWIGAALSIEQVAGWLLALSLIPPAAAVLLYVYRDRVRALARSLLLIETGS